MIQCNEPMVIMTRDELEQLIQAAAREAVAEALRRLPSGNLTRPPHVNQSQAAEMLQISRATVHRIIRSGGLTLNRCGLIPIEQVDEMLTARAPKR